MSKYTHELDVELKLINREEFFNQFLHPSAKTDDLIDMDIDEKSNIELSRQNIVDIITKKESIEENEDGEEKNVDILKEISVKEALNSLDICKLYRIKKF